MKEIPLTQGKFAKVDDEDYECLNQWKWHAHKGGKTWYARRNTKRDINGKQKIISMHRVIMGVTDPEIEVDHIDHDGLNCQRNNMRTCSHAQNVANRKSHGKSKYLGVDVKLSHGVNKYRSRISKGKYNVHLGLFPHIACGELLAALAYDIAAEKEHGEFANLNFKK